MSTYYQTLLERELEHIRKTVKITSLTGKAAVEDRDRRQAEFYAEVADFKKALAINPTTGRATDIDAFVAMCNDIVDVPRSALPLGTIIFEIVETVKSHDYPKDDRQTIVATFRHVRLHGHVDNCTANQLYKAEYTLNRVDNPELNPNSYLPDNPTYDGSLTVWPDRHRSLPPKGPRHFKPSPVRSY
ncbi:hypothetical protein J5500_00200 [Candidatus Saccharibacteria bacterium]|nr:hypothetical protein [Candidatus Saccharibacteria bacterium]